MNEITVPCNCPGKPHSEDIVRFHPTVTVPLGMAIYAVASNADEYVRTGLASSIYLHLGIASWNKIDEESRPIPLTPANVDRLLPFGEGGYEVAIAASEHYGPELFRPLGQTRSSSSVDTSTASSTPPSPESGPSPETSPARSSHRNGAAGRPSEVPVP